MAELSPLLKPVAWLVGRWESVDGSGSFPTINNFRFKDVVEWRQVGAQPLLAYSASSSHPEKGNPMHLESGFLRAKAEGGGGDGGPGRLSFMVAHNFGLTTMEEGTVLGGTIELQSTHVGRMEGAKDPSVTEIKRVWTKVSESEMTCRMWMATTTTPTLTDHLLATYKKVEEK